MGLLSVVDPRKTKLKAGHAAKTRLDARWLADALRRDSVVRIYIPPPEIRALREVSRGRHQLVRVRTRLAQMIRALLLRCEAGEPPATTLYAARALEWLTTVQLAPEASCQLRPRSFSERGPRDCGSPWRTACCGYGCFGSGTTGEQRS